MANWNERIIPRMALERTRNDQRPKDHKSRKLQRRSSTAAWDHAANFRPSPGVITRWELPGGPGVRLDTHVVTGYRVPPNYDSMVAKLLVYQPTRAEAVACMRRALAEFAVEGIKTTIPIHREIFDHPNFVDGNVDTTIIERTWQPAVPNKTSEVVASEPSAADRAA